MKPLNATFTATLLMIATSQAFSDTSATREERFETIYFGPSLSFRQFGLGYGIDFNFEKRAGGSFRFGSNSTREHEKDIELSYWEMELRKFVDFASGVFLGGAIGQQTAKSPPSSGELVVITDRASARETRNYRYTASYLMPQLGYIFTETEGILVGVDLGYQSIMNTERQVEKDITFEKATGRIEQPAGEDDLDAKGLVTKDKFVLSIRTGWMF